MLPLGAPLVDTHDHVPAPPKRYGQACWRGQLPAYCGGAASMPARSMAIGLASPHLVVAPRRRGQPARTAFSGTCCPAWRFFPGSCDPGRLLLWHQAQPGAEVASLLKAGAIANRRHDGARDDRSNPGTVIKRWQGPSCSASASISADTVAMRSSNRRQSSARSLIRRTKRGERVCELGQRMSGNALRKGAGPCRTVTPRSIRKPLIWLITPVRCLTRRERTRCSASRSI